MYHLTPLPAADRKVGRQWMFGSPRPQPPHHPTCHRISDQIHSKETTREKRHIPNFYSPKVMFSSHITFVECQKLFQSAYLLDSVPQESCNLLKVKSFEMFGGHKRDS